MEHCGKKPMIVEITAQWTDTCNGLHDRAENASYLAGAGPMVEIEHGISGQYNIEQVLVDNQIYTRFGPVRQNPRIY